MKCEDYKMLMLDALYDEIGAEDQTGLEQHLESCAECAAEFAHLKATAGVLEQWPDVDPKVNLTFVQERQSAWGGIRGKLNPGRIMAGLGIACASFLLLLSLAKTRIQVQDGRFSLEMGLFGKTQQPAANYATADDIEALRNENIALVSQLMEEYSRKNKVETVMLLNEMNKEIEQNRGQDMKLVSRSLEQLHYGANQRQDRTDQALGALIKYVNYKQQGQ